MVPTRDTLESVSIKGGDGRSRLRELAASPPLKVTTPFLTRVPESASSGLDPMFLQRACRSACQQDESEQTPRPPRECGAAIQRSILRLQSTAGNQAVATLLQRTRALQRSPAPSRSTFEAGATTPAEFTIGFAPPTDDTPVEQLGYTAVLEQIHQAEQWLRRQTTSSATENRVSQRLEQLYARLAVLDPQPAGPGKGNRKGKAPAKGGPKGSLPRPAPSPGKPRSLDAKFDPLALTPQERAAELDAIVAYLATDPPPQERSVLERARFEFEYTRAGEQARKDTERHAGEVRGALKAHAGQRDELVAIATMIEGIYADPASVDDDLFPTQWLMPTGSAVVPLAAKEVTRLYTVLREQMLELTRQIRTVANHADEAWTERYEKNNEHPVVHGFVKFTSGARDISDKENRDLYSRCVRIQNEVVALVLKGQYVLAAKRLGDLESLTTAYANRIAQWEEKLVGSARKWVIGLTLLKDALSLAVGVGAGAVAGKLVAGGASVLRAGAKVTTATTLTGGTSAAAGSAVDQAISGKGISARKTFRSARIGTAEGFSVGASPGAAIGVAKALKVGQAATRRGNIVRGVTAESLSQAGVAGTTTVLSGEGSVVKSAGIAGASGLAGKLGGQFVEQSTSISKAGRSVLHTGSQGGASVLGARLAGAEGAELISAGALGVAGSGYAHMATGRRAAGPKVRKSQTDGTVLAERTSPDGHSVKVLKDGRIIVCSDCGEIRRKFASELAADVELRKQLREIERMKNPDAKAAAALEFRRKLEAADVLGVMTQHQRRGRSRSQQPTGRPGTSTEGLRPEPPEGHGRSPETNGGWDGPKGNSGWISFNRDVVEITGGQPVRYVNGEPVLEGWAKERVLLHEMTGHNYPDFVAARLGLMRRYPGRWRNQTHVEHWELGEGRDLHGNRLGEQHTWHHEPDIETMSLVPLRLHENLPHLGGASSAREGREPERPKAFSVNPM